MRDLDFRPIVQIRQDLQKLDALIAKDQDLIRRYPDDLALKVGSLSLEHRQYQVLKELERAQLARGQITFDVTLNGKGVARTEISAAFLGDFLSKFQNVLTTIVHHGERGDVQRGPISNEILANSQVNLVATVAGSVRVILSSNPEIIHSSVPEALEKFNIIVASGDDFEKIRLVREEYGDRVLKAYQGFLKNIMYHEATVTLFEKIGKERFSPLTINAGSAAKTIEVIEKSQEMPDKEESYTGALKAIDTIDKTFRFAGLEGEPIKGKYLEEIESKLEKSVLNARHTIKLRHIVRVFEAQEKEVDEWILIDIH